MRGRMATHTILMLREISIRSHNEVKMTKMEMVLLTKKVVVALRQMRTLMVMESMRSRNHNRNVMLISQGSRRSKTKMMMRKRTRTTGWQGLLREEHY